MGTGGHLGILDHLGTGGPLGTTTLLGVATLLGLESAASLAAFTTISRSPSIVSIASFERCQWVLCYKLENLLQAATPLVYVHYKSDEPMSVAS